MKRKMNISGAKSIPLEVVLRTYGHEPTKRTGNDLWYYSPFREERSPSFKIHEGRNIWYDHGEGQGGDVISLMMRLENTKSVSDCLQLLDQLVIGSSRTSKVVCAASTPANHIEGSTSPFELERIGSLENRALLGYAWGRGIPKAIAQAYLQEIHYRHHGKPFFAIAFPNDAGGFELRNPYFQGVYGPKAISTLFSPQERVTNPVAPALFEGFSDFLSALVYYQTSEAQQPVIILNSAAMRDQAIEAVKAMGAEKVYLYFDHDKTGRQLTTYVTEQLSSIEVLDKSDLYQGFKDFNELLVNQRQQGRAA